MCEEIVRNLPRYDGPFVRYKWTSLILKISEKYFLANKLPLKIISNEKVLQNWRKHFQKIFTNISWPNVFVTEPKSSNEVFPIDIDEWNML